jgi:hypothetical protein
MGRHWRKHCGQGELYVCFQVYVHGNCSSNQSSSYKYQTLQSATMCQNSQYNLRHRQQARLYDLLLLALRPSYRSSGTSLAVSMMSSGRVWRPLPTHRPKAVHGTSSLEERTPSYSLQPQVQKGMRGAHGWVLVCRCGLIAKQAGPAACPAMATQLTTCLDPCCC